MDNNIILTGFMAVGKGSTARELAKRTGMYTLDGDDLIESLTNLKVSKIFEKHGEEYFRKLERKTALWIEEQVSNTILSTGGGFVSVPNLVEMGVVVYLHNEFDDIISRIHEHPRAKHKISKRPLLSDLDKARKLYEKRLPLYRSKATHEINVGGKSITAVAEEISLLLGL